MTRTRFALFLLVLATCTLGNNWPPSLPGEIDDAENPAAIGVICPADDGHTATFPPELPRGETVSAGALPGSFDTSPSGDATYVIPLVPPPGRMGVEPRLSLAYHSSSGEGFAGLGFDLGGLSAVHRCPSNLAQDGVVRPVRNDELDHYCLDGARLVEIAATPGPNGTSTREYRTFPDTFSRVLAHYPANADLARGPDSFEVYLRSGRIVEYGGTPASRAMAGGQRIAAWWVSRERDRRGNALDYGYDNDLDPADGHTLEITPASIHYAHDDTNKPTRLVRLVTSPLPTPVQSFHAGLRQRRSRILSRVDMVLEPEAQVVRSYRLHHEASEATGRPLLRSVEECAGTSGPCKPATHFDWSSKASNGPVRTTTPVMVPDTSFGAEERFLWVLADVNGDGLDDIVISHPSPTASYLCEWWVGLNNGGGFDAATLWSIMEYPLHQGSFHAYPIDYDQDGLTDILFDVDEGAWPTYRVLRATPAHIFEVRDTGILRPPMLAAGALPDEISGHRFMRLGDVNGDGMADLIECVDPYYDGGVPATRRWSVHLWSPDGDFGAPGFEMASHPIPSLDQVMSCGQGRFVYVADTDGDGRAELVVPFAGQTWGTVRHVAGDEWETAPLFIPFPAERVFTRLHFLDVNGDGLSDVLQTGVHHGCYQGNVPIEHCGPPTVDGPDSSDLPGRFDNTGAGFGAVQHTLPGPLVPGSWTDFYAAWAAPLDWNGDGRTDLMLPVDGMCGEGTDWPCWVVLQSSASGSGMMTPVPLLIPARPNDHRNAIVREYELRVTDVDGDGRHDLIGLAEDPGRFAVYRSEGPRDLLVSITDGMSPLDPGAPGFVPTVAISYDSLVDRSITDHIQPSALAYDELTYVSRSDPDNGCAYPRACVVSHQPVVKSYAVNDGQNQPRRFDIKYRDGRYDRRGRGFLGFRERIVIDADTGAGTLERYDNITHDAALDTYPRAGHVVWSASWTNTKPSTLDPGRVEITFQQRGLEWVTTNAGATYAVFPSATITTREHGTMAPGPSQSVLRFVRAAEQQPLNVLGRAVDKVVARDGFGNPLVETHTVEGADLSSSVVRGYDNDTDRWLIGMLASEEVCSTASQVPATRCRRSEAKHNSFGEVVSAWAGDPLDPGTQLALSMSRDARGHVTRSVAEDGFGHRREACVSYDAEGIFPFAAHNALQHITFARRDRGTGALLATIDENGLVSQWAHDGFGRVTSERRPDGTTSHVSLGRVKAGGPQGKWWSVQLTSEEEGAPTTTVTLDALGRGVHSISFASSMPACGASTCQPELVLEQETRYDHLGRVTRRTLPWMVGDLLSGALHHDYEHDASGRLIKHTEPWGRVTSFTHHGAAVSTTDWLGTSIVHHDGLGRAVKVVDNLNNTTETLYGPFSDRWSVVRFFTEMTITERDAYGRVVREVDPDRGVTKTTYDGFGQPLTIDDAEDRHYELRYDALGRKVKQTDPDGVTRWEYDIAPNGVGKLAAVDNGVSVKRYSYDKLSRPSSVEQAHDGETLRAGFEYDEMGRVKWITYPEIPGVDPLVVQRDYDDRGNLIAVGDDRGSPRYWHLDELDGAGRAAAESFGNGAVTRREVAPRTGLTRRLQTALGGTTIQDLAYDHDQGLRMSWRADHLQVSASGVQTELFQHDALGRLTCARVVSMVPGSGEPVRAGPCDLAVEYAANGNILSKSDAGAYTYDPLKPHAVATAGADAFGYDRVGNQTSRPGATIQYTAFDLPSVVTRTEGSPVGFLYDGHQARLRKTSATEDILYFEDLYERVQGNSGPAEHRYYVAAGSATLAISQTAGEPRLERYAHADALGSTDVVSEGSAVAERRSYDPFGKRRNPAWGQPWSGAAPKTTPLGFTGHEGDDDLGLVNMRGRMYDPRLGRFLSTDPIIAVPHFGQSWNAYSYVYNSPLNFVDPSGFQAAPPEGCGADGKCYRELVRVQQMPAGGRSPTPDTRTTWLRVEVKDASRDDRADQSRAVEAAVKVAKDGVTAYKAFHRGFWAPVLKSYVEGLKDPRTHMGLAGAAMKLAQASGQAAVAVHAALKKGDKELAASEVAQRLPVASSLLRVVGASDKGIEDWKAGNRDPDVYGENWGAITGAAVALVGDAATVVAGVSAASGAVAAAGGAGRASVALDTNALIAAVEGGQSILGGRAPVVPITVAKEFLKGGGSSAALREFLIANGGRIGLAGSEATAAGLRQRAAGLGRALHLADSRVAASAMREGIPLITNDRKFGNFLRAIGYTVERF